eukprot:COSAG01_NODE_1394_length_10482_cov_127.211211_6_plen_124_part_00
MPIAQRHLWSYDRPLWTAGQLRSASAHALPITTDIRDLTYLRSKDYPHYFYNGAPPATTDCLCTAWAARKHTRTRTVLGATIKNKTAKGSHIGDTFLAVNNDTIMVIAQSPTVRRLQIFAVGC